MFVFALASGLGLGGDYFANAVLMTSVSTVVPQVKSDKTSIK